jgi:hypothetical protein
MVLHRLSVELLMFKTFGREWLSKYKLAQTKAPQVKLSMINFKFNHAAFKIAKFSN